MDFLFGKLFLEQCSDLPDADTLLHRLGEKCYGVRVVNSSALTLSWLAQGYFGAFVCLYRKPEKMVDIRAGLLIAQEA